MKGGGGGLGDRERGGSPSRGVPGCSGGVPAGVFWSFSGVFQGVLALFQVLQTPEKDNGNEKKGREMEGEVKEWKVCKTKKSKGNVRKSMERKWKKRKGKKSMHSKQSIAK